MTRKDFSRSYFLENGWIIALLVIVILILWQFGVFQAFLYGQQQCIVSDDITCIKGEIYTDAVPGQTREDYISLTIKNELNHDIHNTSIVIPVCNNKGKTFNLNKSDTYTHTSTHCNINSSNSLERVEYDIVYYSSVSSTPIKVDGILIAEVTNTQESSYMDDVGKSLYLWFKRNIG